MPIINRFESILHASSEPIPLAQACRERLGLQTLYLADLDAIEGRPVRLDLIREMAAAGLHFWIDAGARNVGSIVPLLELDPVGVTIVAGLETLGGPRDLVEIVARAGAQRVIFSLELFNGLPRIGSPTAWRANNPRDLAEAAIDCGVRRLLILDLARVGTGRGLGTHDLLAAVVALHPSVNVAVGGGLSRIEEVIELRAVAQAQS